MTKRGKLPVDWSAEVLDLPVGLPRGDLASHDSVTGRSHSSGDEPSPSPPSPSKERDVRYRSPCQHRGGDRRRRGADRSFPREPGDLAGLGSLCLGLMTPLGLGKTIETITKGFGDIMAEVGLLIVFGVLMGAILQEMGAIERLVIDCSRSSAQTAAVLDVAGHRHAAAVDLPGRAAGDLGPAGRPPHAGSARWVRLGWPPPWPSDSSAASSSWCRASARWPWRRCCMSRWARCCSGGWC